MHTLLTSNFPLPGNDAVAAYLKGECVERVIDWMSPEPDPARFLSAREQFATYGLYICECKFHDATGSALVNGGVLYLSGGDPIRFREAIASRSPEFRDISIVLGASGGAMQLGLNVSIYRLLDTELAEVIRDRKLFAALGLVPFEIVPHFDRHSSDFIETIRRYSALVENDIWCLPDGTAVAQLPSGNVVPIGGALCMRHGEIHAPDA